ncbi:putative metallopeptidase [Paenibacillus sp. Leaf72]|uniref:putative metallopeptidase n=1 Tax=Paenibacillus sp. Leaf72 TaxID=1736234 RepID=UPI0006F71C9D|nr:putative metallopeptidase [Paenibacillus sp. Leaf72]KQN97007.1 hypothetical protein ASF12_23345 [Paenibacillus sp. Leaf72]
MSSSFEEAVEIDTIIKTLLSKETEFRYLQRGNIIARFRTGSWMSKGRVVYGKAKVLTAFERFETNAEILILINKKIWPYLSEHQKEALIFHELCHIDPQIDKDGNSKLSTVDGRPVFKFKGHDLEEFRYVVEKYGLWMPDTQDFITSAKKGEQLSLGIKEVSTNEGKVIHFHLHAVQ